MEVEEHAKRPESIFRPFLAALASFATQFQMGAMLGQSSTMLPQLEAEDSLIPISKETASWIAAVGVIGTPLSSLLCGSLCDRIGRKSVIMLHFMTSAVGHVIVGVASNVHEILIGRAIIGISAGLAFPSTVYISEIASPAHRSFLLYMCTVSSSLGLVYVYAVGRILPYDITSLITTSLAILSLCYTFFIPESPPWLFQNHNLNAAIESIKWLKGPNVNMEEELKSLKDACQDMPKNVISIFNQFFQPTVYKPFMILSTISFLQNATGFYILLYYSVDFMKEFKTAYDSGTVSIGIAVTRLVSCTIASIIISRLNRKILGSFSGYGMGITLAIVFAYLYTANGDTVFLKDYSVIPVICMVSFVFTCGFGVHPLPWLMIYELYPLNVRGRMCGVSNGLNYVFTFIFLKLYYIFIFGLGFAGTILLFMVCAFLFGLFSTFVLPETQGKSLVEIERQFKPKAEREKNSVVP